MYISTMKYDKNTEPKSYLHLLFRGYNKYVTVITVLMVILPLLSISKYPEYWRESIAASAFSFLIVVIYLTKMWQFYLDIKKEAEYLRKMEL